MDRFLVRTPRLQDSAVKRKSAKKKARQSTLEALAGVVNIKDFQAKKDLLERPDTAKEDKIRALKELSAKRPCKDTLVQVGIGRTIKNLSKKDSDPEIREAAEVVYQAWKRELERRIELAGQKIPVRSDLETERLRGSSRKFLLSALTARKIKDAEEVARAAEEEIFIKSNKLVGKNYRRLSRKVIFHLKSLQSTTHSENLTTRTIKTLVDTLCKSS